MSYAVQQNGMLMVAKRPALDFSNSEVGLFGGKRASTHWDWSCLRCDWPTRADHTTSGGRRGRHY